MAINTKKKIGTLPLEQQITYLRCALHWAIQEIEYSDASGRYRDEFGLKAVKLVLKETA